MFSIIPIMIFYLLLGVQPLFIPITTTIEADNINSIAISSNPQLLLNENENYIKITKSTDLNQLFKKYPQGEIVNDFNDDARIFIFDIANLVEDLLQ
ncbi:conserved hypothetical protein [Candida dubliniensis CD36]|uniref:Uncharacterized protein n=1 Tax=Candida dubliniensis (strain CD36 / ATCC MYA-646 / CBS 7987 / NCPF 3949 / NRRL Y-17841) TaxID=573826 RepID=B9WEF6_CANDC|nr:conserved hypothetical protein [Candida dubliniensis CD36]CAX43068.1 conserved hypothetical protein [Candida dubliniensis CD36]